jgi:hypothetical protein
MRRLILTASLALMVAVCGRAVDEVTTVSPRVTSTTPSTRATSTTRPLTPEIPPTTTPPPGFRYSVEALGLAPDEALGGDGALGSGCAPGTDLLPDGAWFGWLGEVGATGFEFDLACLWPGRIDPAAGNESTRLRTFPVVGSTLVYASGPVPIGYEEWSISPLGPPLDNAPGLADTRPVWVFVNDSVVTELAMYQEAIQWAISKRAWPGEVHPGCCDQGAVVPASPAAAWPGEGWPVNGFYDVSVEPTDGRLELTIRKWLSCRDHPGLCPEWWVGDEVTVDPEQPALLRTIPLDERVVAVIMPFFGEGPLVGDGAALEALLADIDAAVDTWLPDVEADWPSDVLDHASDPSYPFGVPESPDPTGQWPIGYRGPGGDHLTRPPWWAVLEMRDGEPILYFHAGLIAG